MGTLVDNAFFSREELLKLNPVERAETVLHTLEALFTSAHAIENGGKFKSLLEEVIETAFPGWNRVEGKTLGEAILNVLGPDKIIKNQNMGDGHEWWDIIIHEGDVTVLIVVWPDGFGHIAISGKGLDGLIQKDIVVPKSLVEALEERKSVELQSWPNES